MRSPRTSVRNDGRYRRTILVADDDAVALKKVSAILAKYFDLVAAVRDGRQALRAALLLDPELIVLDVALSPLSGYQTASELRRAGSRAKIVMLTIHELDDAVAAAIESGAQGYVLKTRMQSDLVCAIDHAIDGRLFVPSLTSLPAIAPATGAGRHLVQLGIDDSAIWDQTSGLLSAVLRGGEMAAILAGHVTRAGIAQRLIAAGCDIAQAADEGRYVSLDVTAVSSQVMVAGRLDAGVVTGLVEDLERSRLAASAPRLTIVGEMSARLCQDGNSEAAIQLEHLWDDLTRRLPFLTVCPYPMECFSKGTDLELLARICGPHSAVCHAHDE